MAAAIWSTPAGEVGTFPAEPFLRFFDNHGLLSLRDRPAWRTVAGGSRTYVDAFRRGFRGRILTSTPVAGHPPRRGGRAGADRGRGRDRLRPGRRRRPRGRGARAARGPDRRGGPPPRALALPPQPHGAAHRRLGAPPGAPRLGLLELRALGVGRGARPGVGHLRDEPAAGAAHAASSTASRSTGRPRSPRTGCSAPSTTRTRDTPRRRSARSPACARCTARNRTHFCGSYHGYGFHEDAVRSAVEVARGLGLEL